MKTKLVTIALSVLFVVGLSTTSYSNNLSISSVVLTNDTTLTFNISWDNSWRTTSAPNNLDAVWLFVKKKDCTTNVWSHVNLNPTSNRHSVGSPLEIYIDGKDGSTLAKGVFVRSSATGSGSISSVSVSLRMVGLSVGSYDFKVFGIEMVQIPQGAFYLGDGLGAGNTNSSYASFTNGTSAVNNNPFQVSSEAAITAGVAAGQLYYDNHFGAGASFTPLSLPAGYPKGYNEIYCMKYEMSQGQYVDYLNTLTSAQAAARGFTVNANRVNVTGSWPNYATTVPHRAIAGISWFDILAYLDWSALRPMTELEFEKIARGPNTPVYTECAWGSTTVTDANTLVTDGTVTENVSNAITAGSGLANYNNTTVLGPIRCGFAAKAGTNRLTSGAGYYGVMELSGNVSEQLINTLDAVGVAFTGVLGDGDISAGGFADVTNWPSSSNSSSPTGGGWRGGDWNYNLNNMRVSHREAIDNVNAIGSSSRNFNAGGRGVR